MHNPITLGMIKADISMSTSALNSIPDKNLDDYSKGLRGIAAYHAQQALEKLIKYEIYNTGKPVNNRQMYTHNLANLCALADSLGVHIPKEVSANANFYSDWEASGRYDLHFVARRDSIKKALRLANEMLRTIEERK